MAAQNLKLYLGQETPPFIPASVRGSWHYDAAANPKNLGAAKSAVGSSAAVTIASASANRDGLCRRFISAALAADTYFKGVVAGVLGAIESNVALNAYYRFHAYVIVGSSGDTLRGTIVNGWVDTAAEWGTAYGTAGQAVSAPITELQAYAGDTLVIEIGARCNADATTYTAKLYNGYDTADLAVGGDANNNPGYLNFGYDNAPTAPVITAVQHTTHIDVTWA